MIVRPRAPGRIAAAVTVAVFASLTAAPPAAVAGPAVPQTGYLSAPTEQLALPGDPASGEITPEGDIYTGWAEYGLAIGPRLTRWDQPTRVLPNPAVPAFLSELRRGTVSYAERVVTSPVGRDPVVQLSLTATDLGRRPALAQAALGISYTRGGPLTGFHGVPTTPFRYERPATTLADGFYFQLGQSYDPAWRYIAAGRDIDRAGRLLVRGPAGAVARSLPGPPSPQAIRARQSVRRWLEPGRSVTWSWLIPLAPPPAGAPADAGLDRAAPGAARRAQGLWAAQERGMMRVALPEGRVTAVYQASVAEILDSGYRSPSGWVQAVNRLQYQSYWIRDSALETVALDQVGLHAAAARDLAFLSRWQQPGGEFISRTGQQDGVGQALWEMAEHAQLAHDAAYARAALPAAGAAVSWIARVSTRDAMGLLPPSTIHDDEFLTDARITGDNLWAADGLRSAVALARIAGRPDLAAAWQALDTRFERSLDAALAAAARRAGHIPPALDRSGGTDWGNFWAAYPLPILSPTRPAVAATVRWALTHGCEGIGTYRYGGLLLLHDYLDFPIFETELAAGDVPGALAGFYAELDHTTAPGYGWEDGPTAFGRREDPLNLAPHGTFAADYVSMLRNMLVLDDGAEIHLLAGTSPAWLAPGDRISVSGAPTGAGTVSFTLVAARSGQGARLSFSRSGGGPARLVWDLPYWARDPRSAGGRRLARRVTLSGRRGTLTVTWRGRRPGLSLAAASAALDGAYRARRLAAPLAGAPGW